jgi:hypothetical protein
VLVPQMGWHLRLNGCAGHLCCHDEENRREVVQGLPEHPSDKHKKRSGDPAFVLPRGVAALVLQRLELPPCADEMTVYVGEACALGDAANVFVRAVWFTPHVADAISGRVLGSHARDVSLLHRKWLDTDLSKRGEDATQPASGRYVELGLGNLPGYGRTSLGVGGGRSVLPFPRNPVESDEFEPLLSEVMSDVSAVIHHALPLSVTAAHAPLSSPFSPPLSEVEEAFQYPRLRREVGALRSHQVVLRGPRRVGVSERDPDADREACLSVSDLHVDPWDGGGSLGTCTVHTCSRLDGAPPLDPSHEDRHLECRGTAVFPHKWGGRGVHVMSMVPGWNCAILMRTSDRLHGSVMPGEGEEEGFGLPRVDMLRVVTYPLRRIERLVERLSSEPSQVVRVVEESHAWVRSRVQGDLATAS